MSKTSQRPLERIEQILKGVLKHQKRNPDKETFNIPLKEFSAWHNLLADKDGLEIAFKKIFTDGEGVISLSFEFMQTGQMITVTEGNTKSGYMSVKAHVEDIQGLEDYLGKVQRELYEAINVYDFILDLNGRLTHKSGDANLFYQMKPGGLRYKILTYLASGDDYVATSVIALEFGITKEEVRKVINDTKQLIAKKLKVSKNAILESNGGSGGYRVVNLTI